MKQDYFLNDLPCEAKLCPSTLTYLLSSLHSFPPDCFHTEWKAIWRRISIIRSHFWNTRPPFNKRTSMKVIEVSYLHLAAVSQPSDTQAKPKNLLSLPSAQIYLQRFFLFVIVSLSDQQLYLLYYQYHCSSSFPQKPVEYNRVDDCKSKESELGPESNCISLQVSLKISHSAV